MVLPSGEVTLQKAKYDNGKIPEDVDKADLPFGLATSYDKEPEVEVLPIERDEAERMLTKQIEELRAEIAEQEEEHEAEEDEGAYHLQGDYLMSLEDELKTIERALEVVKG